MLKVQTLTLLGESPSGEPRKAILCMLNPSTLAIEYCTLDEHKSCDSEITLWEAMQFTQDVFDDLVDHEFKLTHYTDVTEPGTSDYDKLSGLLADLF